MSVVTEAVKAQRDEWAECIREARQMPGLIEAIKAPQEAQAKMIRDATPLSDMLKAFPERFGSLYEARQFMDTLTHWYNHEHRHTGIGLHTPANVHFGLATDKAADRRTVLTQARARHPHRFGTAAAPKILDLPDTAWINRPAQNTTQETATTAA